VDGELGALGEFERLRIERAPEDVLVVELHRPERRNAVDPVMHHELASVFRFVQDVSDDIGAIVITGSGEDFSVGGDLGPIRNEISGNWRLATKMTDDALRIVVDLLSLRPPVIGALNGNAVGLGCTIGLLCDIVVMADDAVIGDPHTKVGLTAGDGGTFIWPALIGPARAKEFLMTGELLSAERAREIGLVNHLAPRPEVRRRALEIAGKLSAGSRAAIRWTKHAINSAMLREASSQVSLAAALEGRTMVHPDLEEGTAAFEEKRRPSWPSAQSED
jgi:enoyl-CoA hydratase/carnithine racemase